VNADLFVVDTHALVHFANDDLSKLGSKARKIFEKYEAGDVGLFVPTPVMIETWYLALAGDIEIPVTFNRWWRELESRNLFVEPLLASDVLSAASLAWTHDDPFDRLIVATALRLGAPLITRDRAIAAWGGLETLW
jgi:PIN domain nuclease of toxin-antitoxin system